ncbi:dsRBD fold-containing protein [Nonomuraea sp. B19D2]|uniref:dsRBD fold-containing protein n=1 Tax=Nonomuraea sp. B19D2 TaxID=3159561 RepID=UPI0032DBBE26
MVASKQWTVQIYLAEEGDETSARAVLITRGGGRVDGLGRRRRTPADAWVPEIGDELAASRALADLADKVAAIARQDQAKSPPSRLDHG